VVVGPPNELTQATVSFTNIKVQIRSWVLKVTYSLKGTHPAEATIYFCTKKLLVFYGCQRIFLTGILHFISRREIETIQLKFIQIKLFEDVQFHITF
jgi:hypothetical protein